MFPHSCAPFCLFCLYIPSCRQSRQFFGTAPTKKISDRNSLISHSRHVPRQINTHAHILQRKLICHTRHRITFFSHTSIFTNQTVPSKTNISENCLMFHKSDLKPGHVMPARLYLAEQFKFTLATVFCLHARTTRNILNSQI
jgi:hypothetical protein